MKQIINYNGKFFNADDAIVTAADHSCRYGDGLFETMKVADANILLAAYHFERLFSGIDALKFKIPPFFTEQKIEEEVKDLCRKNKCEHLARVRLAVSRGSGGLYDCDDQFSYVIECWPLRKATQSAHENGLVIDVFPDSCKSCDKFSNLKSANYLPYVMAALWAKENKLDDALILNQHQRICDATIANVFWVKGEKIFTPPLTEGCVAGVMRRNISDFKVNESLLTVAILIDADEVFLTNAVSGIRWVKQFRDKTYTNRISSKIFSELLKTNSL